MNEVAELELPTQENVRTDLRSVFQGAIRAMMGPERVAATMNTSAIVIRAQASRAP